MLKKAVLIVIFTLLFLLPCVVLNSHAETDVAKWNVSTQEFMIDVWKISPWWDNVSWVKILGTTWEASLKTALQAIIENLIISIWAIAVLVMTVWGGYMIFDWWDWALLWKWKTMFKVWIIAVSIALASWILVKFVAYLLYT